MTVKPRLSRFGFFPPSSRYFGGGGKTQAAPPMVIPSAPIAPPPAPAINAAPTPVAAPPATATSTEVVQAQNDVRRQALKRRGFSKTVFAGDTGGWASHAPGTPQSTKLGQ